MQASVPGEIRWRLSLYTRSFELCTTGGFSLARLLALVPDRLRLAEGDTSVRIRVPVAADPRLQPSLRETLPGGDGASAPPPASQDALRRWLRLAQVHPEVDPLVLQDWLTSSAQELLDLLARLHRQALAEVGRGEGGLETAYLAHLALMAELVRALEAKAAPAAVRAVVAELAPVAWAEVAAGLPAEREVPARLALQIALTSGLVALGASADGWAELPANPRRTLPDALRLARRVLQPPLETFPLERAADTIARRLLAEPRLSQAMLTDLLMEQARDAALLLVARLHQPGRPDRAAPAVELARSPRALTRALFHHGRRRELLAWLAEPEVQAQRAAQALTRLLEGAEAVAAGDPKPLGVHGDLEGRAALAARGALLTALDEHTLSLVGDVTGLLVRLPAEVAQARYTEGRAYRLSSTGEPLFLLPDEATEAVALVDWSGLLGPRALKASRGAALVSRHVLEPLARAARAHPGVRSAFDTPTQAAFRGPPAEVVGFAQDALRIGAELAALQLAGAPDVLGGTSEVTGERTEEVGRLTRRIEEVERALARSSSSASGPDDASLRMLLDSKALLMRQRDLLTGTLAAGGGAGEVALEPALVVAVAFGEAAVDTGGAPFSPALVEAGGLVERSAWVGRQRSSRWEMARAARGDPGLRLPFAVSLRVKEGQPALYNGGCVITDAARVALEEARAGTSTETVTLELRLLPDVLRARYVFDLDPEELRLVRGTDGRVVYALRRAGELAAGPDGVAPTLWELLPDGLELLTDLFGPGVAR
ncbi:MAG: hypothetical protein H6730_12430 [Deltaproteobacteria bacterium]|nr:hypothetical protein [Deltaproteobacteria bacterium]